MALTTLGNTAFSTSAVVSATIKDSAVVYNKLDANTAHTDRNQSFSVGQRGSISALGVRTGPASTNTVTLDMNTSNYFSMTANANLLIANPTNLTAGQAGALFITANGSYTTSFGSQWRFATGSAPTLSTSAGKVDRLDYVVQSSNTIHTVATIDLLGTA
tara:strand:- start:54 stop:533 length:480 start_codon:yes stop_codon:yes gene_type:complete